MYTRGSFTPFKVTPFYCEIFLGCYENNARDA